MTLLKALRMIHTRYRRPDDPFTLSSGVQSRWHVDVTAALTEWGVLADTFRLLGESIAGLRQGAAVGGPAYGADPLAVVLAGRTDLRWFSVRQGVVVGSVEGRDCLLVDDVATTGESLVAAKCALVAAGAQVSRAVVLVDRSRRAVSELTDRANLELAALYSYADLGIPAIEDEEIIEP